MKVVAFTRPERFSSYTDETIYYPFDRVAALWHDDGVLGEHIGERDISQLTPRGLEMAPELGRRLMASFGAISAGKIVNCHRFSRYIANMPLNVEEPRTTITGLQRVEYLPLGAVGLVGAEDIGVPHSIGYGMGDESLQVMSWDGELGFARNVDVLEFYSRLFPRVGVGLYQLPSQTQ
jgi:hypothetical protein